MNLKDATNRVKDLIGRWDGTPEWHESEGGNPEFLEGRINISSGDLLAIKVVMDSLRNERSCRRTMFETKYIYPRNDE